MLLLFVVVVVAIVVVMIPLTPLFSRYKDSYLLYSFRLLYMLCASKSAHLRKLLTIQVTYLYHFACLMKYKDIQKYEVQQLIEWALNMSPEVELQNFRIEFIDKTNELNLRSCQPKSFMYTFTTIWDTIHFLCLIADDMVYTRERSSLDLIAQQLKTIKVLFYNMFFVLQCAMCRDHYMNIKGYMIYHLELMEIALDKERYGDPIVFVDTYQQGTTITEAATATTTTTTTNTLMTNLMVYVSMLFHNHVNDYKWLQRNIKPPIHYERMTWSEYKKLLNI